MADPYVPAGRRRFRVVLEQPGPLVPDGDGGYTQDPWVALGTVWASILGDTREQGRSGADTVAPVEAQRVVIPYHPAVTTETRVRYGERVLSVVGMRDIEGGHVQLELTCVEVKAIPHG